MSDALTTWVQDHCLRCDRRHAPLWPACQSCSVVPGATVPIHGQPGCTYSDQPTYDPDKVKCGRCGQWWWILWTGGDPAEVVLVAAEYSDVRGAA